MFTGGIVLALLIGWPFFRAADKLSPPSDSDSADELYPFCA
jgi:hypothetical protein